MNNARLQGKLANQRKELISRRNAACLQLGPYDLAVHLDLRSEKLRETDEEEEERARERERGGTDFKGSS